MASNRKKTKPAVKSSGATVKLGHGQTSKNSTTLRRKSKADSLEEEYRCLEDKLGLATGSIYDEKGADNARHQLDNPEVYGQKSESCK